MVGLMVVHLDAMKVGGTADWKDEWTVVLLARKLVSKSSIQCIYHHY
jgi:hypothetical protein